MNWFNRALSKGKKFRPSSLYKGIAACIRFIAKKKLKSQLTMRLKLILSFSGLMLIFIIMILFNIYLINQTKQNLSIQNNQTDLKLTVMELKNKIQELNIIGSGLEISKNQEYIAKFKETKKLYDELVKKIGDTAVTPEEIKWRSQIITSSTEYLSNFESATRMITDPTVKKTDLDMNMMYLYEESQKLMNTIFESVDQFYNVYSNESQASINQTVRVLNSTFIIMLVIGIIILAATAAIAYTLFTSFIRPIKKLQNAVGVVASGDLRYKISSAQNDELGQLSQGFDQMIDQVRGMLDITQNASISIIESVQTVLQVSDQSVVFSKESKSKMHTALESIMTQSESIAQISITVNEMAMGISKVAEASAHTYESSLLAQERAREGELLVVSSIKQMDTINSTTEELTLTIDGLQQLSFEIRNIASKIGEIASRTNILALNSAIEAARAGQAGKGFAVIADEVRKLADESKTYSQEVVRVTHAINADIGKTIQSMAVNKKEVNNGIRMMNEVNEAFAVILKSIEHIVLDVQDSTAVAEQMSASSQQVSATLQEMVTHTTLSGELVNSMSELIDVQVDLASNLIDSVNELSSMGSNLSNSVKYFKVS